MFYTSHVSSKLKVKSFPWSSKVRSALYFGHYIMRTESISLLLLPFSKQILIFSLLPENGPENEGGAEGKSGGAKVLGKLSVS